MVVVGGGVIGSSVAFHLATIDPRVSVVVVERDPTYRTASSALSVSSIRQQFSTPVNIAMSRYGFRFLQDAAERLAVDGAPVQLGLVERGYLFMATAAGEAGLRANHATQRRCGADVELVAPDELARRYPWLATGDLALAALGCGGEGWFDGYALLQALKRKARSLGVEYRDGDVVGFDVRDDHIGAVRLHDGTRIACGRVVNAAGPHAGALAALAGVDVPVTPEKHSVFVFSCPDPPPDMPMLIDPAGAYCRPEGRYFIGGVSRNAESRDGAAGLEADYARFDEQLWPRLAARVPAFERIRRVSAWAGYYEMNGFDHNALLGATPQVPNLYLANGFSGHGMQHAPAAGLAVAEMVLFGESRTLDVSALSYLRYLRRQPLREVNVI